MLLLSSAAMSSLDSPRSSSLFNSEILLVHAIDANDVSVTTLLLGDAPSKGFPEDSSKVVWGTRDHWQPS